MNSTDYFLNFSETVQQALYEDIRDGDLTADLVADDTQTVATIISREESVMCGQPWAQEVFKQVDDSLIIEWQCSEGDVVSENQLLCTITGSAKSILTAERTALNFLQTLMATAYQTHCYVKLLGGSNTRLLDTRKTLPGLRLAQKYAVNCGGGKNHRIGLFDAILIKENHIMAAGGIYSAVSKAQALHPGITVEVETENMDEVQQALDAKADIIMLDNFTTEAIEEAVKLVNGAAKLEVSGNVEGDRLQELAATGVDFVSTGAITKHIKATDLSMRFK